MAKSDNLIKYQNAIADYERYRAAVKNDTATRAKLFYNCNKLSPYVSSAPCLTNVLEESRRLSKENGEYYSFYDVLDNDEDGICCDSCKKAHILKRTEHAKNRQQFGIAKRRLSALGKTVLKQECNN